MPINAHYAGHTRRATLRPPTSEKEVCRARPADSRAHASLSIPPNNRKSWGPQDQAWQARRSVLLHPTPGVAVANTFGEVAPLRGRGHQLSIDILAHVLILVHAIAMKLDLENTVLWIIADGL